MSVGMGNSNFGLSWFPRGSDFRVSAYVGTDRGDWMIKNMGLEYITKNSWVKIGHYKPPLWPEDMKEDRDLSFVYRSRVSLFLDILHSSNHHPCGEAGFVILERLIKVTANVAVTKKYDSDASRRDRSFANPGHLPNLFTVRVEGEPIPLANLAIAFSENRVGKDRKDRQGIVRIFVPSIQVSKSYQTHSLYIESAYAFGKVIGKDYRLSFGLEQENISYFDASIRWRFSRRSEYFISFSGFELSGGYTHTTPDLSRNRNSFVSEDDSVFDRISTWRVGIGFYFGKNLRLQINGERELFKNDPSPEYVGNSGLVQYRLRSQLSFNF